jgi:hypothetical protein
MKTYSPARHGEASAEIRQAKQLMDGAGQLYFDFRAPSRAARASAALDKQLAGAPV